MGIVLEAERPPMVADETGTLRVGDSRVLVDVVIRAFQAGATPETIHQRFPSASLPDIYGVVSYYLRHQEQMDNYLMERKRAAADIQSAIENRQGDQSKLRTRLLARLSDHNS